jgi:cell division protein FtsQ
MKKYLRIAEIVAWIVLAGGLGILVGFTNNEHNLVICRQYSINIDWGTADVLVTKDDIYHIVKQSGQLLKGQPIGYIDAERIESTLKKQPYITKANVFITIDGKVVIDVTQSQPVLRIFNQKGESFYLDALGQLLPLNPAYSARVIVANGFIDESYSRKANYLQDSVKRKDSLEFHSVINHLFKLSLFIQKDQFLKALIEQIYVDKNGEMELIPRIGNQTIIFGDAENIPEKFERLKVFYTMGLSKTGWNKYNVINIKFKNQVIGTKL